MTVACVYWLHSREDIDPDTQGYIGVAEDFDGRLYRHIRNAKRNSHQNKDLQNLLLSQFVITFLYVGEEVDCYNRERRLRPAKHIGLNIAAGGKGGPITLGMKMSKAFREKRRLHMIGNKIATGNHKPKTEEHRRKIGRKGRIVSLEQRKLHSDVMTGRRHTPEHNKKIGESSKGKVWWNHDGIETKSQYSPGSEWVRGRTK